MNMFRILVADDHPILRFGLCSLLESHEGWEICGQAADGREAVEKCKLLKPDLLILDISMPKLNGVDAARQILKNNSAQRILVFTDVDSEQVVRDCIDAGIRGWVFKSDGANELMTAVELMQRRQSIFSAHVSELIMEGYLHRHRAALAPVKTKKLSTREREVVQLVAEGKSSKEVATILNMAVKTAETHRSNIMIKLELHSVAALVLYAVKNEIVHVPLPAVLHIPSARNGRVDTAGLSLN